MLNSLKGKRELLSSDMDPQDPRWRSLLDDEYNMCLSLENTVSFMSMTIGRHSDFHKTANGLTLTPDLSLVYVDPIIDRVVMLCRESYEDVEISVIPSKLECFSSKIFTDASWLFDNMLCIVSNAAKFTRDGTVGVHVSLIPRSGVLMVQDFLRIEVHDAGEELDEATIDSFFSLFKARQEKVGGTGLGLYCLKCRVNALHGACGVQRRNDRSGLIVWFEIPYIPEAAKRLSSKSLLSGSGRLLLPSNTSAEDLEKEWKRNSKIGIISTKSLSMSTSFTCKIWRVLLLDTSEEGAHLADSLGRGNFDVTVVDDLTTALGKASQNHFDIVIVDHKIYKSSGGDLGYAFKEIEGRKLDESLSEALPGNSKKAARQLMILTGDTEDNLLQTDTQNAGMDAFMSKMTTIADFESFVRSFYGVDTTELVIHQQSSLRSFPSFEPQNLERGNRVRFRSEIYGVTSNRIPFRDPESLDQSSPPDNLQHKSLISESASSIMTFEESKSVLIVDDSPTILNLLSKSLMGGGYTVVKACNGLQALDVLRERRFDAVIMDQQMPFMDGTEAISSFRFMEEKEDGMNALHLHRHKQLIIAISANSDEECRRKALQSGANYFLAKPFAMSRFEEILNEYYALEKFNRNCP